MATKTERLGCTVALLGTAVVLVLFVLAVARTVKPDHPSAPAPPKASSGKLDEVPGTRALLDGIGAGDIVEGWRIDSTRIVKGKRLALGMQRGRTGFTVWIVRKGAKGAKLAPQQTAKYDLYVGEERLYGAPIPEGAENRVLEAIVKRVKRAESHAPTPAGM